MKLLWSITFTWFCVLLPQILNARSDNNFPTEINNASNKVSIKEKSVDNWWDKSMPWITAGLIGGLTVIVNHLNSKRNEKIAIIQVQASTNIALKQIDSSKTLALGEFQATLKSKNRQDWINEVRDCLSEYLTHNKALNIEFQSKTSDKEKIKIPHGKATYHYNKISLLLDPSKVRHKKLLDLLRDLGMLLDEQLFDSPHTTDYATWDGLPLLKKRNMPIHTKLDEILTAGRELLYYEWQKIQEMEGR